MTPSARRTALFVILFNLLLWAIVYSCTGCAGVKYHGQAMTRSNPYYKTAPTTQGCHRGH